MPHGRKGYDIDRDKVARNVLILASIISFLALMTYTAGLTALRYNVPNTEQFHKWQYWKYWITSFIPFIPVFLAWFILGHYRGQILAYLFFIADFAVAGCLLVVMVWDIIIITECNDTVPGPTPVHPHCFNRNSPSEAWPDEAFILTFAGIVGQLAVTVILFGYGVSVQTINTSTYQRRMNDEDDDLESSLESKIGSNAAAPIRPQYITQPFATLKKSS